MSEKLEQYHRARPSNYNHPFHAQHRNLYFDPQLDPKSNPESDDHGNPLPTHRDPIPDFYIHRCLYRDFDDLPDLHDYPA